MHGFYKKVMSIIRSGDPRNPMHSPSLRALSDPTSFHPKVRKSCSQDRPPLIPGLYHTLISTLWSTIDTIYLIYGYPILPCIHHTCPVTIPYTLLHSIQLSFSYEHRSKGSGYYPWNPALIPHLSPIYPQYYLNYYGIL